MIIGCGAKAVILGVATGKGGKAQSRLLCSGVGRPCDKVTVELGCDVGKGDLWPGRPLTGETVVLLAGVNSFGRGNGRSGRNQDLRFHDSGMTYWPRRSPHVDEAQILNLTGLFENQHAVPCPRHSSRWLFE